MKIAHLTLMVNNLEKSIEFYETITELTVSRRFNAGPGEIAFMTNVTGDTDVELVFMPQGQKFEGKGFTVCFETENLDEVHNLAKARELNPSDIRNHDAKNRYFYVYDPNGVSVEIKQML